MFAGFTPAATDFLWNLRFNNNKDWFNAHKPEFQTVVQAPFRELANEVLEAMREQYPELSLNLHISRIYRDARRLFGRGPMKDHLWFSLFCGADKDEVVPTFFFSFEPEGYYYGVSCGSANLPKYRAAMLQNPEPMRQLAQAFAAQDRFVMEGEKYVRPKAKVEDLLQPWFDHRRLSLCCARQHGDRGYSPELKQDILEGYTFLVPYYRYWLRIAQQAQ